MFTRLLELQELDTLVDQLRYRRDHLPQRAALKKLAADSSAIDARQAPGKAGRADLAAQAKRPEDEVAPVPTKATAEGSPP